MRKSRKAFVMSEYILTLIVIGVLSASFWWLYSQTELKKEELSIENKIRTFEYATKKSFLDILEYSSKIENQSSSATKTTSWETPLPVLRRDTEDNYAVLVYLFPNRDWLKALKEKIKNNWEGVCVSTGKKSTYTKIRSSIRYYPLYLKCKGITDVSIRVNDNLYSINDDEIMRGQIAPLINPLYVPSVDVEAEVRGSFHKSWNFNLGDIYNQLREEDIQKMSIAIAKAREYYMKRYDRELSNPYPQGLKIIDDNKVPWHITLFSTDDKTKLYNICNLNTSTHECENIEWEEYLTKEKTNHFKKIVENLSLNKNIQMSSFGFKFGAIPAYELINDKTDLIKTTFVKIDKPSENYKINGKNITNYTIVVFNPACGTYPDRGKRNFDFKTDRISQDYCIQYRELK